MIKRHFRSVDGSAEATVEVSHERDLHVPKDAEGRPMEDVTDLVESEGPAASFGLGG